METPRVIHLYSVDAADENGYFEVDLSPFNDSSQRNSTFRYHYPYSPGEYPENDVVKVWIRNGDYAIVVNPNPQEGIHKRIVRIRTVGGIRSHARMEFDPDTIISFIPWP